MHLVFDIFTGHVFKLGRLFEQRNHELLDTDAQGLQLELFDQHADGAFLLPSLNIEHALAGFADGISCDVIYRVYIYFETGHSIPVGLGGLNRVYQMMKIMDALPALL